MTLFSYAKGMYCDLAKSLLGITPQIGTVWDEILQPDVGSHGTLPSKLLTLSANRAQNDAKKQYFHTSVQHY